MAMVLGIGFLLLVTLVFDAVDLGDGRRGWSVSSAARRVLHVLSWSSRSPSSTVLFAAIFRILPDLKIAWHDVWLGARLHLRSSSSSASGDSASTSARPPSAPRYGAAGSLVILLVWVYWSAQILFFGAEFTQVYARTFGTLKGDTSKQRSARPGRTTSKTARSAVPRAGRVPCRRTCESKSRQRLGKLAAGGSAGSARSARSSAA